MTQGSPAHRRVAHPPWKGHRPGLRGPRPVQAGTLETWFQECEGLSGWGRLGLRPDQALDGQSPLREGEIGAGASLPVVPAPCDDLFDKSLATGQPGKVRLLHPSLFSPNV